MNNCITFEMHIIDNCTRSHAVDGAVFNFKHESIRGMAIETTSWYTWFHQERISGPQQILTRMNKKLNLGVGLQYSATYTTLHMQLDSSLQSKLTWITRRKFVDWMLKLCWLTVLLTESLAFLDSHSIFEKPILLHESAIIDLQ